MADAPDWNAHLPRQHRARHGVVRGRRRGRGASAGCGARRADAEQPHIGWLAVRRRRAASGRRAGRWSRRDRVTRARRRVRVVTFGAGHPGGRGSRARAPPVPRARLRFEESTVRRVTRRDAARVARVGRVILRGDGFSLRPLRQADAAEHKAGEDDEQLRGFEFPGPASIERVDRRDRSVACGRGRPAVRSATSASGTTRPVGSIGNVEVRVLRATPTSSTSRTSCSPSGAGAGSDARGPARARVRTHAARRAPRRVIEVLTDNTASLGVARGARRRSPASRSEPTGSRYLTFSLDHSEPRAVYDSRTRLRGLGRGGRRPRRRAPMSSGVTACNDCAGDEAVLAVGLGLVERGVGLGDQVVEAGRRRRSR